MNLSASFVHGTWTALAFPGGCANFVLLAEISGTLVYDGISYAFAGHTVEIAIATSGRFGGTYAAGGASTDALTQSCCYWPHKP